MSLDLQFCKWVLENNGLSQVLDAGITEEMLIGGGRDIFREMVAFRRKYDVLPSAQVLVDKCGCMDLTVIPGGDDPLDYYLDGIRKRHAVDFLRVGLEEARETLNKGEPDPVAESMVKAVHGLRSLPGNSGTVVPIHDSRFDHIERYGAAKAAKEGITGLRMPWPILNGITGGLQPTDYVIWVGKRGLGKSWIVANHIAKFAADGVKVLVVSMEMPKIDIQNRVACIAGRFNPMDVRLGRLPPGGEQRYLEFWHGFWETQPHVLFAEDGRVKTVEDLDLLVQDVEPDVVIVDGLYLLNRTMTRMSREERVANISTGLRFIAKDRKTVVLGTSQFNRELKVGSLKVSLDQVGMSDSLTFDPTHIWAIAQDKTLFELDQMRVFSLKVREGLMKHIDIHWRVLQTKYDEIGEARDLEPDEGSQQDEGGMNY